MVVTTNPQWVECDGQVILVKRFWQQEATVYDVDEVAAIEFVGSWHSFNVYKIHIGYTTHIFLRSLVLSNV